MYLAAEVSRLDSTSVAGGGTPAGAQYAIKKLVCDGERLEAVRNEVAVQQRLSHPNVLPLLDACEVAPNDRHAGGRGGGSGGVDSDVPLTSCYLLFPALMVSINYL